jgi:hypothetical protein
MLMHVHTCHMHICSCPCPLAPLPCHMPPCNASRKTWFSFSFWWNHSMLSYCPWHTRNPCSMLATTFGFAPPYPPFALVVPPPFHIHFLFLLSHVCFRKESWHVAIFFVIFLIFSQEWWERVFDGDEHMHMIEYFGWNMLDNMVFFHNEMDVFERVVNLEKLLVKDVHEFSAKFCQFHKTLLQIWRMLC